MSSGHTTVPNLLFNMSTCRVGLVGKWDCVAFDKVGGVTQSDSDMVQTMKNYMANGSFGRGTEAVKADASIAFEGNTFRSVADMLRTTNLFDPFPSDLNGDSAFFDRIHAYLPGWETPKLRASLFTKHYGFITGSGLCAQFIDFCNGVFSPPTAGKRHKINTLLTTPTDCFSEFCHGMRKYDFTNSFGEYFELNRNFNTRDDTAVRRTFSGLAKLIYPDEVMSKVCVILAGYRDEMARLLNTNPGFASRIAFTVDFPDYTAEELREIAKAMLKKKGYHIAENALDRLTEIVEYYRSKENFANARTVRNVLEQVMLNQNLRAEESGNDDDNEIIFDDVEDYLIDEGLDLSEVRHFIIAQVLKV